MSAVATLLHPFATGDLTPPDGPVLFMRAQADPGLARFADLVCWQTWRPAHDALAAAGRRVTTDLADGPFAMVLVLLGRDRDENLGHIGAGLTRLAPAGLLVVAGANQVGAASYEKHLRARLDGVAGLAKHKGRVFWAPRPARVPDALAAWAELARIRPIAGDGFMARPGLFAADAVDRGSALLADHLPEDLGGVVADLGAGWGYLSVAALARCPGITRLDLYEAEHLALEAARANLARHAPDRPVTLHWQDVAAGITPDAYDAVIMNPPFHVGPAPDPALGQAFVNAAAAAVRPGGRLFLVANRQLPYEKTLTDRFDRVEFLAETGGYKVIAAVR